MGGQVCPAACDAAMRVRQNGKVGRTWAREPRRSVAQTSARVTLVARLYAGSAEDASVYTGGGSRRAGGVECTVAAATAVTPPESLSGVDWVLVPRAMNFNGQVAVAGKLFIP